MLELRRFDLNLLIAFDALMSERSVTRAAARINIGQPAMSHALSRLREAFGDELFVRTPRAMQPTERAMQLSEPIARVLADIRQGVLAEAAFEPATADVVLRVGASDYAEVAVLPQLLAVLRKTAPRVRLAVSTVDQDRVSTMLETGMINVAIGYFPELSHRQHAEILFREEFVCVFDAQACGVDPPLKLRAYLDLPHVMISMRGDLSGRVDELLARGGGKRFVFMATPHFLTVPFLLHGFRAVAALPRRLAENCTEVAGLAVSPLPIELEGFDVSMIWHARAETDPAQRWLRELLRNIGRADPPRKTRAHSSRGARNGRR